MFLEITSTKILENIISFIAVSWPIQFQANPPFMGVDFGEPGPGSTCFLDTNVSVTKRDAMCVPLMIIAFRPARHSNQVMFVNVNAANGFRLLEC